MAVDGIDDFIKSISGAGKGRLLASVAFGWFLILGMRIAIPGILPTITDSFGATAAQAGLAMTALWATYAIMQFPAGYYADRLGERTLLLAALLTSAGATLAYVVTPTFALFVVATAVFGLGNGLYGPPRGLIVSKTFEENDSTAFAIVLSGGSIGAAVLPAIAALAVVQIGWRGTLGAVAPALVVGALAMWWWVPKRSPNVDPSVDTLGSVLRSSFHAVRNRRVLIAVTGVTVMLFVFQAATTFLAIYLVDIKGITQQTAGAILGSLFIVATGSHLVTGRLADRYGSPPVLVGICLISAIPLLVLPWLQTQLSIWLASALIGIRMSVSPISHAYIIDVLPKTSKGTAWGALRTEFFLVSSVGSTIVGVMADAGLFDIAFYLMAGLTAAGAVIFYFLPARS